jgi:hypothetical protein
MQKLPGIVNYFIGNNRRHWNTDITTYRRVEYRDVYPGIDLAFKSQAGQLEYDWIVKPGANPGRIRLRYSGDTGGIGIGPEGALRLGGTRVSETRPVLYQVQAHSRQLVHGEFRASGNQTVRFQVGRYDHHRTLTIDPVIKFAKFLGGFDQDLLHSVQVDSTGNIYVAGETKSPDLPTQNALAYALSGPEDMCVIKLNPNGGLVYSTYIGGSGGDAATGIAVDRSGEASIVGTTGSPNFPVVPQATRPHGNAGVILSLGAGGNTLRYSILISDAVDTTATAAGTAIADDVHGNTFATVDVTSNGSQTINVAEIDRAGPTGPGTNRGTIGPITNANSRGIAVLKNGDVVVVGITGSATVPTKYAAQATFGGGIDAFVTELDSRLKHIVFSTYLGSASLDGAEAVTADGSNHIYVAGQTRSNAFPAETYLGKPGGIEFGSFVAKFSATGHILYSTVVMTTGDSECYAIAVNKQGYATIGGESDNTMPMVRPLKNEGSLPGPYNHGFVLTLGGAGKRILFSSYIGGSVHERVSGLAMGGTGNLFATGWTDSADFPRTGGQSFNTSGDNDGFLVKIGNK